ncbi:MAG: hypothetical protein Unbinned5081contig1001_17 [Prokaryotic dsDNA virus sp.]|nr:MAG: hypothetical protein Unbinned5081contig1001_17 [Prokaryotic dsDNA virus sp.]|tara:strand:- start:878 stop:1069 length:192 start_codon:yes stop_codon:yes gene_type:complete
MNSKHYWETHLYTYAVALIVGQAILVENMAAIRKKAIRHGHTVSEVRAVEADPVAYAQTGRAF